MDKNPEVMKGKRSTSSTSKIKNTRAIIKKRIDRGIRADDLFVNPHSNGANLFRSLASFRDRLKAKIATIAPKKIAMVK